MPCSLHGALICTAGKRSVSRYGFIDSARLRSGGRKRPPGSNKQAKWTIYFPHLGILVSHVLFKRMKVRILSSIGIYVVQSLNEISVLLHL